MTYTIYQNNLVSQPGLDLSDVFGGLFTYRLYKNNF